MEKMRKYRNWESIAVRANLYYGVEEAAEKETRQVAPIVEIVLMEVLKLGQVADKQNRSLTDLLKAIVDEQLKEVIKN